MIEKNYTLFINVYAKGGNVIRVGPFEILIGCHSDIPIIFDGLTKNKMIETYPLMT